MFNSRVYSEELLEAGSSSLFIKNLSDEDSGTYACSGDYGDSKMRATVQISTFGELFVNMTTKQKAVLAASVFSCFGCIPFPVLKANLNFGSH